MPDPDPAREQAEAAAAEAAAIGGRPSSEPPSQDEPDEAGRPVAEGGGGEAEGFEEAERELIEHSSQATSTPPVARSRTLQTRATMPAPRRRARPTTSTRPSATRICPNHGGAGADRLNAAVRYRPL